MTSNNQELESRFHSFTAAPHIDIFTKHLPYLNCGFSHECQTKRKIKFRIMMFPCVCTSFVALYVQCRPVESQLGPWGYKQHGPLCRSSSTGARWTTTSSYQFKSLKQHWYSIMQPSFRTNLTSKEVL